MNRTRAKHNIFMSLVIALAAISTTAFAQDDITSLSLEETLERAAEQSHEIRLGETQIEASELAVGEARAGRLPNVSGEGQYTNNLATPFIVLPADSPFGEGVLRTGNRHNFNASAQISVPIYSRQLNRSIDLSLAARDLEVALHSATIREVNLEVQRAFLNALIAGEAHIVLQQSHETLQQNLDLVTSLFAEGAAPEYDLLRTEVQVRNLEPDLASAKNNYDGALNYVKLLTGIPIDDVISLDGSLEELYASLPPLEFEATFERNRDFMQLEGQRQLAGRRIAIEKSGYWPSLSAFGNFSYQGQGDDLAFWNYNWGETAVLGVSLAIPIFTPGLSQRIDQVEMERVQAEMQQEYLIRSLRSQYETTSRRISELDATIEAQERNISQAERGYEIARASYEEGVHSLMEVNDAETALRDARLNYMTALNDYINAILDMEDLVGSTLTSSAFGPR